MSVLPARDTGVSRGDTAAAPGTDLPPRAPNRLGRASPVTTGRRLWGHRFRDESVGRQSLGDVPEVTEPQAQDQVCVTPALLFMVSYAPLLRGAGCAEGAPVPLRLCGGRRCGSAAHSLTADQAPF